MNSLSTDILIVGGGPAGLAAALGASQSPGLKVTVVDDNPLLGGQIWRSELGTIKSKQAKQLIKQINHKKIDVLGNYSVFAQSDRNTLLSEGPGGSAKLNYRKLILANGARERFLPFPGWTLPNVFGAAGLQALVKGGLSISGKRIIVAGTGPLLLAVADYFKSKGATVLSIVEQTGRRDLFGFALGLWKHPKKCLQAIKLKTALKGVDYSLNSFVTSVEGEEILERVLINQNGSVKSVECDILACGYHLVPNTELAAMIGCKLDEGCVSVDQFQKTSLDSVYCAGEPTGVGGVDLSLIEGEIAGLAAIGESSLAKDLFKKREKEKRFAAASNRTFALQTRLKDVPMEDTIVCRCEDIPYGELAKHESFRDAKLQTRCGMGACQGRVCGSATDFLFDWENTSVRPPVFPVKLKNLI